MTRISRRVIQVVTALVMNSYVAGFLKGTVYQGTLKKICFPGLNCSSCPGALGSCPLALVQNAMAEMAGGKFSFFIFGFLGLTGITLGRYTCGWLCPFGLIQELIYRIPLPKAPVRSWMKKMGCLKYAVLIVFVLLLPALGAYGVSRTAFCTYFCPVEVLEAYFPLILARPSLMSVLGFLFKWKLILLIMILFLSALICKPFCRFFCPLGAIYSLFNPVSIYRFQVQGDKCTGCGRCRARCKLEIDPSRDPNNRECMRCNECLDCPAQALGVKYDLSFLWQKFIRRFSIFDLIVIALTAALGVATKPIIVSLSHILTGPLFIPGGTVAGGFYMMWLVLGTGLTGKRGTASLIGLVQGIMVLSIGVFGSHGVLSLFTYTIPGIMIDLGLWVTGHQVCCLPCAFFSGILANMSGSLLVNLIYFRLPLIPLVLSLSTAALSGGLGGVIAFQVLNKVKRFQEQDHCQEKSGSEKELFFDRRGGL